MSEPCGHCGGRIRGPEVYRIRELQVCRLCFEGFLDGLRRCRAEAPARARTWREWLRVVFSTRPAG